MAARIFFAADSATLAHPFVERLPLAVRRGRSSPSSGQTNETIVYPPVLAKPSTSSS